MGQRLPVDDDRLGGVLGALDGIRDHEGDRIADVAHLVRLQHPIGRDLDPGAGHEAQARQMAEPGGIGAGEHQRDPRHGAGLRQIGDAKARMRVRRAHHHRMEQSGRRIVGHITAGAAHQRIVLQPPDRLPDAEFAGLHGCASPRGGPCGRPPRLGAPRGAPDRVPRLFGRRVSGSGRCRVVRCAIQRAIT